MTWTMSHWLTQEWKYWWLRLVTGVTCPGWKNPYPFILFKLNSETKHSVGINFILFLLSLSREDSKSCFSFPSLLCLAATQHCWSTSLGSTWGFGTSKTARKVLAQSLANLRDELVNFCNTRNKWKQGEEGKRRSCNSRSWTSEEQQLQVHRWVPVRVLSGQVRRWE